MERWFGLRITVTGTRLQSFRMDRRIVKDDSPEEALKAISMIAGCKYRIKTIPQHCMTRTDIADKQIFFN